MILRLFKRSPYNFFYFLAAFLLIRLIIGYYTKGNSDEEIQQSDDFMMPVLFACQDKLSCEYLIHDIMLNYYPKLKANQALNNYIQNRMNSNWDIIKDSNSFIGSIDIDSIEKSLHVNIISLLSDKFPQLKFTFIKRLDDYFPICSYLKEDCKNLSEVRNYVEKWNTYQKRLINDCENIKSCVAFGVDELVNLSLLSSKSENNKLDEENVAGINERINKYGYKLILKSIKNGHNLIYLVHNSETKNSKLNELRYSNIKVLLVMFIIFVLVASLFYFL
jgi:hypothetical protein